MFQSYIDSTNYMKHFRLKHPEEHKTYHAAKNALKAAKKAAGATRATRATQRNPAAVETAENRPVAHEEAGQESEQARGIPRNDEEEVPVEEEFDEAEFSRRMEGVELEPRIQEPEYVWKFKGAEAELVPRCTTGSNTEQSNSRRRKSTPRKIPQADDDAQSVLDDHLLWESW
jgi:hypothetical protein